MVKIAIAGGSGQVAREVLDALLGTNRHDITILSRKAQENEVLSGVSWRVVDYNDKSGLVDALRGMHTVLSFIQLLSDPGQQSQKNLIDACVGAGVKRFAPSEYGSAGLVNMPWWAGKQEIRIYLQRLNEKDKVLEYTLFQPGLFLDYLAYPFQTAKHVPPLQTVFDFQDRRAMVVDGHEGAVFTLTTARDLAAVVARAVEYEGVWPEVMGIRGDRLTAAQIIEIGERVRGQPFTVDKLELGDLEAGELKTTWGLEAKHRAVEEEQAAQMVKMVSIGMLLSSAKGAWDVSDSFNEILPGYEFTQPKAFLEKVWAEVP